MVNVDFWAWLAATPIVLWLVSSILILAQRPGLYKKRFGSQMRYAKPIQQRLGYLLIAVSLPWAATWQHPIKWYWPSYAVAAGLSLVLIYLSGPNQIQVDTERQVYTAKYGWPFRPKVWYGSLDEVAKLHITNTEGFYLLIVRWKVRRPGICIGCFWSRSKAEEAAAEIANGWNMNLPIGNAGVQRIRHI